SDSEYKKFTDWVAGEHFAYSTTLDKEVDNLVATARQERYYDQIEGQLLALKKRIGDNKLGDIERFIGVFRQLLEQEITFHYGLHTGRAENSLGHDKDVIEAKRVLNDTAEYNRILKPAP